MNWQASAKDAGATPGRALAQESSDDVSGDIITQDTAGAAASPVLHLLTLLPDAGQVVLDAIQDYSLPTTGYTHIEIICDIIPKIM